ncbi:MAG: hypothetical protein KIC47_17050 [Clostridium sp.]|uniref:hypothetical protein n=1 Tax=Clostridium neonatale TaxID=137838 RepID=UPI001DF94283|nr:hypothetical protein [Clostridium neonatale]MBS5951988.1 hypothetical protein [Clostridium sp.]CAI3535373.1 conserved hypothetical protein [Clostridium neonatale]
MEYISAKEFLKQPKEVQETFIEWWKPSIGDLITIKEKHCYPTMVEYFGYADDNMISTIDERNVEKEKTIPLFTEGQLRKFIEDKTECKIETVWCECGWSYNIDLVKNYDSGELVKRYYNLGEDLLQAYWTVACEIAKEG